MLSQFRLLSAYAVATIPARVEPLSLREFFQSRDGLTIDESLYQCLGQELDQVVVTASARTYQGYKQVRDAWDVQVADALGLYYHAYLEDVAALIGAQWNGGTGSLSTIQANAFYVSVGQDEVVVRVSRLCDTRSAWLVAASDTNEWRVYGRTIWRPQNA